MPVEFRSLYELADCELTLGLANERLLERARAEANGINARIRQIYCELRAKALEKDLNESSDETNISELRAEIEFREKRLRTRKERNRWLWAATCFVGIVGTFVFPRLAIYAHAHNDAKFYVFAFLGVGFLVLTVMAYMASQYHTHTD